jgi:hypothetical protein
VINSATSGFFVFREGRGDVEVYDKIMSSREEVLDVIYTWGRGRASLLRIRIEVDRDIP